MMTLNLYALYQTTNTLKQRLRLRTDKISIFVHTIQLFLTSFRKVKFLHWLQYNISNQILDKT
jgi:hypothetical protein